MRHQAREVITHTSYKQVRYLELVELKEQLAEEGPCRSNVAGLKLPKLDRPQPTSNKPIRRCSIVSWAL
jgi:hypothetical protein